MISKSLVIIPLVFSLLIGCSHSKVNKFNIINKSEAVVSDQDDLDQTIKSMDYINKSLDKMNTQMIKNNSRLLVMKNAMEVIITYVCPDVLSSSTAKDFPDQVVECQKIVENNYKGHN